MDRIFRHFLLIMSCLILLCAYPQESQAGKLSDRLQSYPDWNSPPNISQAEGDLIYPNWMEGTWEVTSILVDQVAPLAPEIVTPGFRNNQKYLDVPLTFQVRFQQQTAKIPNILSLKSLTQATPRIVANREFNGYNIAKAYLGEDEILSVKVDPNNPNRQITFLSQNNQLISTVANRESESLTPDTFLTTEITQQVFQRPLNLYINQVETTTEYHLISDNKIEAHQVTAIYLSPEDPDYFKAINRPVALYKYQLKLSRL